MKKLKQMTKELRLDMFTMKIRFVVGTVEENKKYVSNFLNKVTKIGENCTKENYKQRREKILNRIPLVKGTSASRLKIGEDQYYILIFINGDLVESERMLKKVLFHETRHAVDQIVTWRNLSFDDVEFTAELQSWINVEFLDTVEEWWKENKK